MSQVALSAGGDLVDARRRADKGSVADRRDSFCMPAEACALLEHLDREDAAGIEAVLHHPSHPVLAEVHATPIWPEPFEREL